MVRFQLKSQVPGSESDFHDARTALLAVLK